MPNEILAKSR